MRKAIVTAIIGDKHRNLWERNARDSWQRYATRHGYEIILVQSLLDGSPLGASRQIPWQKLLIFSEPQIRDFDRVVWIDADIIINDAAPSVIEAVPEEKIGAVPDQALLSSPTLATVFTQLNKDQGPDAAARARKRYAVNTLSPAFDLLLNTGVMVLSPRHHRDFFEHVYNSYGEGPNSFVEQMPLSYEILSRDLYHPLDPRFNVLWFEYKFAWHQLLRAFPALAPICIANALANSFFLHFALHTDEMNLYDPRVIVTWDGLTFPTEILDRVERDISRHRQGA